MQIGDRVGHRCEHRRRIEDAVGAGRIAPRLLLRPAVARRDQAQVEQPAIRHGARAGADIVGKLRPHQDDDRAELAIGASSAPPSRPVISSPPPPGGALWSVLERDALGRPLGTDRIGAREVACLARGQALGDRRLDRGDVDLCRRGTNACASCCSRPSTCPAARKPHAASKSPAKARSASACIADSASGVFRSSHSASITGAGTSTPAMSGYRSSAR